MHKLKLELTILYNWKNIKYAINQNVVDSQCQLKLKPKPAAVAIIIANIILLLAAFLVRPAASIAKQCN